MATPRAKWRSNPVGTGYYTLGEWVRGNRIVLERNPAHLAETWDFKGNGTPDDARIIAQMKGKQIAQVERVEITVMVEDQSRWLSFQSGGVDLFWLDGPLAPKALVERQAAARSWRRRACNCRARWIRK